MSKSLKYQVVKLAKENPSLRRHLLPLVSGKTANDDGLRMALTKLAYANPSLRSAILPLVKTSADDKVQMLNENGRIVWVKKDTLKGPKGKNYKPIPKDKKKDNSGDHAEWSAKVEKAKKTLSNNEKELKDFKKDIEEKKEKIEKLENKIESFSNAKDDIYAEVENHGSTKELIREIEKIKGTNFEGDKFSAMKSFSRQNEKARKMVQEWRESKAISDIYNSLPMSISDYNELSRELDSLNSEINGGAWSEELGDYEPSADETIEKMEKSIDKQKKELSDLESNEPKKKQQGGGKTKVRMEDGQKVYETPQTKEMKKVIKDTVAELKDSISGLLNRRYFKQIIKDKITETASQEEILDDLDEQIDFYTTDDKRPNLVKALKKLVEVIESKATYEDGGEKKQQGGGGKKKEKPAEETSEPRELTLAEKKKKYKEIIENSKGMSAEEKTKRLKEMNEAGFDLDGAIAGASDDEEEVKTSSLKYELVKLAHAKPYLRKHILPLVK